MRSLGFLPHLGANWLCECHGPEVIPLARAPGDAEAAYRFSSDQREFGVLDQKGKRLAHYRMLDVEPWFEAVMPPTALPRRCHADCLLIAAHGRLIAGGRSASRECLWERLTDGTGHWRAAEIPKSIAARGKSVDALFERPDGSIVAVDDIVLPKWVLVYEWGPNGHLRHRRSLDLPANTTYERVVKGVDGALGYALLSRGVGEGGRSTCITILDRESLKRRVVWWSVDDADEESDDEYFERLLRRTKHRTERGEGAPLVDPYPDPTPQMRPSRTVHDLALCGPLLMLAAGTDGILLADAEATFQRAVASRGWREGPRLVPFRPARLVEVHAFVKTENENGLYAIGPDTTGAMCVEWLDVAKLVSAIGSAHGATT